MEQKENTLDVGLIRTDAPEGTRFLVLRIRPLCHHAFSLYLHNRHLDLRLNSLVIRNVIEKCR